MSLDAEIALAHRLADVAREEIRPLFRSGVESEAKDDASPVTVADRNAEEAMRKLIEAEFSGDGIHGEEFGVKDGVSGRQWVLDPIDGTSSLPRRAPDFRHADCAAGGGLSGARHDRPADRVGSAGSGVAGEPTTFNGKRVETRALPRTVGRQPRHHRPALSQPAEGDVFMALAAKTDHRRMVMGGDCYNYACLASRPSRHRVRGGPEAARLCRACARGRRRRRDDVRLGGRASARRVRRHRAGTGRSGAAGRCAGGNGRGRLMLAFRRRIANCAPFTDT